MKIIKKPKIKIQTCSCCTTIFKPSFNDLEKMQNGFKKTICPVCGHYNYRTNEELFFAFKKEVFKDRDD